MLMVGQMVFKNLPQITAQLQWRKVVTHRREIRHAFTRWSKLTAPMLDRWAPRVSRRDPAENVEPEFTHRETQINLKWGTFYFKKTTKKKEPYSSKISYHKRKAWPCSRHWHWLKRHDHPIQCLTLAWTLFRGGNAIEDIIGSAGRTGIWKVD